MTAVTLILLAVVSALLPFVSLLCVEAAGSRKRFQGLLERQNQFHERLQSATDEIRDLLHTRRLQQSADLRASFLKRREEARSVLQAASVVQASDAPVGKSSASVGDKAVQS